MYKRFALFVLAMSIGSAVLADDTMNRYYVPFSIRGFLAENPNLSGFEKRETLAKITKAYVSSPKFTREPQACYEVSVDPDIASTIEDYRIRLFVDYGTYVPRPEDPFQYVSGTSLLFSLKTVQVTHSLNKDAKNIIVWDSVLAHANYAKGRELLQAHDGKIRFMIRAQKVDSLGVLGMRIPYIRTDLTDAALVELPEDQRQQIHTIQFESIHGNFTVRLLHVACDSEPPRPEDRYTDLSRVKI